MNRRRWLYNPRQAASHDVPLVNRALALIVLSALVLGVPACLLAQQPQQAWKLTLRPTRPGAVFDVATEAKVAATVHNATSDQPAAMLSFEVRDADGKVLNTGQVELSVPRGEERRVELSLGSDQRLPREEYLKMVVTISSGSVKRAEVQKGFGFLPKRAAVTPPESSPFGLLAESDWPLLQRLGVRHVRPNWSWAERPMEWAQRYGIAYCPLIGEANAAADGRTEPEEYAAFVRESVSKFKRYVKHWQLGNEFDIFHRDGPAKYVEVQRIGYEAAKSADPECLVIGGSITELQVRPEGFREALKCGLAKWCDVYDFHFYQSLEVTQKMLDFIHATFKEFHAEKPIWVTETTQVGIFDPDDANQANYVFKRYAHLLANGVQVVFWHVLRWPYPFEQDKVQATALIDYDGFARPGLFAYAALTRELEGARFVRRWDLGAEVYALEFTRGRRSRVALWTEGESREVNLSVTAGKAFVTVPSGRKSEVPTRNGLRQTTARREAAILDLPAPLRIESKRGQKGVGER